MFYINRLWMLRPRHVLNTYKFLPHLASNTYTAPYLPYVPTTTTCGNWLRRCYGWLWRLPTFPLIHCPTGAWWRQSPCKEIRSVHIIWPLLRPEAIENQMMGDVNQEMSMIQTMCIWICLIKGLYLTSHGFLKMFVWMFHPYRWFHITLGEDFDPCLTTVSYVWLFWGGNKKWATRYP